MTCRSSASNSSKGGAAGAAFRLFSRMRADQRGVTLIELLVATALFIGLLAAVVPVFTNVLNDQPKLSKGAARISEARTLMERLGRELRQAYAVDSASASQLVFRTYTRRSTCGGSATLTSEKPPTQCRVTYTCASGTCMRSEVNADGSGTPSPVQVVTGLLSNSVFAYSPSAATPDFVELTLVMPGRAAGEDAITLQDGFEMRNITSIA